MSRTFIRPMGGGWQATFTVERDPDGVEVPSAVAITRQPGEPARAVTARVLRSVKLDFIPTALSYADLGVAGATYADLQTTTYADLGLGYASRPRRGQKHDPRFLAWVAVIYLRNCDQPNPSRATADEIVAQEPSLRYTPAGIRELIAKARARGILDPTSPGRRGGQLKPYGRRLLLGGS